MKEKGGAAIWLASVPRDRGKLGGAASRLKRWEAATWYNPRMTNPNPEFAVVITQMRSLEALFLSETPDKPIVAKDLLTICEAIRTLAEKMAAFVPEPAESGVA